MYAKGMTTRDIEDHMRDIYGIDVSPVMVSKVTDKIMPMIAEWQSRPLERVYPIIFLDAIFFKVRKDNRIINKAACSVLGINMAGQKDILGIWIGENESDRNPAMHSPSDPQLPEIRALEGTKGINGRSQESMPGTYHGGSGTRL